MEIGTCLHAQIFLFVNYFINFFQGRHLDQASSIWILAGAKQSTTRSLCFPTTTSKRKSRWSTCAFGRGWMGLRTFGSVRNLHLFILMLPFYSHLEAQLNHSYCIRMLSSSYFEEAMAIIKISNLVRPGGMLNFKEFNVV